MAPNGNQALRLMLRERREREVRRGVKGVVVIAGALWVAGVTGVVGGMTADQRVQQALAAARSGDARTALPLLEQAERMHPFHPANVEVLYQLGQMYIDAGKYEEAWATFEKLLNRYGKYADRIPQVDEAVVSQARVLAGQKKYEEALQHVRKFKRERPRSGAQEYADFVIAYIMAEKGDYGEARRLLENIAGNARHSMREQAYFLLAEIAAKEGKFEQVEVLMQRLLRGTQDREARNAALFKLGEMYRNMGNTAKALDTYRRIKAAGDDPGSRNLNASILVEIGETFEKLGHVLEARVAFEGVAKLYGDTAAATDAWHRAILADADFGDFARAEESYQRFRAAYPGEVLAEDVRYYIAQKMMERNDFEGAIQQLRKGLEEYPTGQWAEASFNALGVAYAGAKRFEEAERTLREFAERFPESELVPDSYFILAETYAEQGRYGAAIELYDRLGREYRNAPIAAEAAERGQEVRLVYAEELVRTNKIDEAVEVLREVTASNVIEQARLLIGEAYARGERYDEAERAYEEFLEEYPQSELRAQALFALADVRMRKEAYGEAEKALREVLAMGLAKTNALLASARLQIGFCRYYADDMDGMTNAMWEVVREHGGTSEAGEALYWLGYAYRSMRAYEAGAEVYRRLAREYAGHQYAAEGAYLVGECYVLDNKAGQAVEGFEEAYRMYPRSGYGLLALVRAGEVYLQQNQVEGWLARLEELKKERGGNEGVIGWARVGVLMRAGRGEEAAQVLSGLDEGVLVAEARGYAMALRAGVGILQGKYAEAEAMAREAVKVCEGMNFGLDEALYQLGRSLYLQKRWAEASEVYERLLKECVIPSAEVNAVALLDRAECLMELGETDEVVKVCDEAIRLRPSPRQAARAVVMKGDAMMKGNEYQKAAQYYQRAVVLYGRMREYAIPAYRGLIRAYTKLGLTEEAARARGQMQQRYPDATEE